MFSKLFGLLGQARAVKNTVVTLVEIAERADDDLDGDGKSELQNIFEDLKKLESDVAASAKTYLVELSAIYKRAERLVAHVRTGK